jgi:hypothetical protein
MTMEAEPRTEYDPETGEIREYTETPIPEEVAPGVTQVQHEDGTSTVHIETPDVEGQLRQMEQEAETRAAETARAPRTKGTWLVFARRTDQENEAWTLVGEHACRTHLEAKRTVAAGLLKSGVLTAETPLILAACPKREWRPETNPVSVRQREPEIDFG